jgi:hypothetical protein
MKTDTTLSRRRLLAGVPAVAAAGVPSVASALGGLAEGDDPIFAVIAEYRAAVVARTAALDRWSKAGEPHSGPLYDAQDAGFDHEHDAMAKFFETFPTTSAGAAALFERLAEQLYPGDGGDFTVMEHEIESWETEEGMLEAKEWVVGMAAALRRIAAAA